MTRYNDMGDSEATCMQCGEVFYFDSKPGNRPMYCSTKCKQAAYRKRKRQAATRITTGTRAALATDVKVRITQDEKIAVFVGGEIALLMHIEAADYLAASLAKATALLNAQQLELTNDTGQK